MTRIDMNLREVKRANYRLPSLLSSLDGIKRDVGILRWRIPAEIQERRNIREDMVHIVKELERIRDKIGEIHTVTEDAIFQYMNVDRILSEDLNSFE